MRTRMYGGVGGRKTKVGRKLTFVFLLPDLIACMGLPCGVDCRDVFISGLLVGIFQAFGFIWYFTKV